jgi:hypothetical protein
LSCHYVTQRELRNIKPELTEVETRPCIVNYLTVTLVTVPVIGIHGLDLCRDHGIDGFKRYVALAVVARNIQRLGAIVRSLAANKRGSYKKLDPYKLAA